MNFLKTFQIQLKKLNQGNIRNRNHGNHGNLATLKLEGNEVEVPDSKKYSIPPPQFLRPENKLSVHNVATDWLNRILGQRQTFDEKRGEKWKGYLFGSCLLTMRSGVSVWLFGSMC